MIQRQLILLALGVLSVAAMALFWAGDVRQYRETGERRSLTQPLRMRIDAPGAFEDFILGLGVYHYRAKRRGSAAFRDVFYDTAAWDLYRRGFSYRFRTRIGAGTPAYTIRFEQEPRFLRDDDTKLDIVSRLPVDVGRAIGDGQWARAVSGGVDNSASTRLQLVLQEIGVRPEDLRPRLLGELTRERFDITDKGRSWFELDYERWIFYPFGREPELPGLQFDDLVLDTRLNKTDPELLRRVNTMYQFVNFASGVRFSRRAPHERAIEEISGKYFTANPDQKEK